METKKQSVRPISYLGLINQFWRIDKTTQFSQSQTRVFFYLLDVANATNWQTIFEHSDKRAAANCGIGLTTFKNARDVLQEVGLLSYISGGHGHANKTKYSFSSDLQDTPVTSPNQQDCSVGDNESDRQGDSLVIPKPSPLNTEINTKKKISSSEAESFSFSIPRDGVERNFDGLKAHLEKMRATPREMSLIYQLSNYGQIGNPVWPAIAEIRRSEGRINQPIRFILSKINSQSSFINN